MSVNRTSDFTGDGTDEFLIWNFDTQSVSLWALDSGAPNIIPINEVEPSQGEVIVGDITGDGTTDILITQFARREGFYDTRVVLFDEGVGSLQSFATGQIRLGHDRWSSGDFDGDGAVEFVTRPYYGNEVRILDFTGSNFQQTLVRSHQSDWALAGTGNLLGSAADELIWRNTDTGFVGVWQMNSSNPHFQPIAPASTDWTFSGVGDFDGDGDDDILWRRDSDGFVGMWAMEDGIRTFAAIGSSRPEWQIAGTGDFNGDGIDDILWQKGYTNDPIYDEMQIGMWAMSEGGHQFELLGQIEATGEHEWIRI